MPSSSVGHIGMRPPCVLGLLGSRRRTGTGLPGETTSARSPRPRVDLRHRVGPIVIGQACEFDYAGCQALKVLREEGYRTVVVNSNPATIMTDPGFADRTYIEPLDLESVASVLARERPDALLPTLGGQTALNLAVSLSEAGVLEDLGVELIGAPSRSSGGRRTARSSGERFAAVACRCRPRASSPRSPGSKACRCRRS